MLSKQAALTTKSKTNPRTSIDKTINRKLKSIQVVNLLMKNLRILLMLVNKNKK